jgi:hypothetical protein
LPHNPKATTIVAKLLSIEIGLTSKDGRLAVTGPFDLGYGFTIPQSHSSVSASHFAAEGVQLKKLDDGKAEFSVSIKGLSTGYLFNLKFTKDDNTEYSASFKGDIDYHAKII